MASNSTLLGIVALISAAQAKLSDADFTSLGGRSVELHAGDVLYLPPGWFHHVTSRTHNVGLNLWTHSLATDVWHQLHGEAPRIGMESCRCAVLRECGHGDALRCAIDVLQALHGDLASRLSGRVVTGGAARLSPQASALVATTADANGSIGALLRDSLANPPAIVKQSCERAVRLHPPASRRSLAVQLLRRGARPHGRGGLACFDAR